MAVKDALLALLVAGPRHGYQLKAEFDEATGKAWPLNYGQVYTTLQRLETAELVNSLGEDAEGRVLYQLTKVGKAAFDDWLANPVQQPLASRDEISMLSLIHI